MALNGTEPTSSDNIKALTDNLKTWITSQINAAKTWTSSQITTAINNLKKTVPQEKELFYSADGAVEGNFNSTGYTLLRYTVKFFEASRAAPSYYDFTIDKISEGAVFTDHGRTISMTQNSFLCNGTYVTRVVGIKR